MGPDLGPSRALHRGGVRETGHLLGGVQDAYLSEIESRHARIEDLAARVRQGKTITLALLQRVSGRDPLPPVLVRELIEGAVAR